MKNTKIIIAFVLGIAVSGMVAYALTIMARDVIYDNTTSGSSATNVQAALDDLYEKAYSGTSNIRNIIVHRHTQVIIETKGSTLSFTAVNGVSGQWPNSQYPAQWYVAGSNDLENWTELLDYQNTNPTVMNELKTVNISGYKYIRFGSGDAQKNYMTDSIFKDIVIE